MNIGIWQPPDPWIRIYARGVAVRIAVEADVEDVLDYAKELEHFIATGQTPADREAVEEMHREVRARLDALGDIGPQWVNP